jgi:hypothetical protein
MKRFWMHLVGAVTALGGTVVLGGMAVSTPACAHDDNSFFLDAVLAPPQGATTGCVYTNDPTQPSFSYGVLDVDLVSAYNKDYVAEFLAGNQLIPQANQQLLMTETSRIIIQGAVVTITMADGTQIPGGGASYTAPAAGEVDPSNGGNPGYGPVSIEIVDPKTVVALQKILAPFERETILTYTKAFGTTLGGDHVESNTFEFPIDVCRGCLINFDTLAGAGTTLLPNCLGPAPTTTGQTACFGGQDVSIDCHSCAASLPFCLCGHTSCSAVTVDGGTP